MRVSSLPLFLLLGFLLAGCVTTEEITLDYPVPPASTYAINSHKGKAEIVLSNGERIAGYELTVDSLMVRWKVGEWRGAPMADVVSMTVQDETKTASRALTGVLYTAAAFGAAGLIEGLAHDREGVVGQTLLSAGVGGLAALVTENLWVPMTEARIRYYIRPPHDTVEIVRREIDKKRTEPRVQDMITDLNTRSRNFRIEPTFLYGRGNSVSPEVDASSPWLLGGGITFGIRCTDNLELGLQFLLASHSFNRQTPDESVRRLFFALTGNYFPFEQSGMFLKGGVGYGAYSATGTYSGMVQMKFPVSPITVVGEGPTFNMGAGYDLPLAETWSIRPSVQYTIMPLGDLKLDDGTVISTAKTSKMLEFCLSVVFKAVI